MTDIATVPTGGVPAELEQLVSKSGLSPEGTAALLSAFAPHFAAFLNIEETAELCHRDAPNVARGLRLKVRRIRIDAENTRKAQKDESLRTGQLIDTIARTLRQRCESREAELDKIERAEEIARQERIAALMAEREEALAPYAAFITALDMANLGVLTGTQFGALLDRAKAAKQADDERIAAEKLEQEKRDKEEREERERLRAENVRLAAVAAEEREAREAAEKEIRDRQAEDARRISAEKAAAAAPDREKLIHFAGAVRALPVPEFESELGCEFAAELDAMIERFARWCESKADALRSEVK